MRPNKFLGQNFLTSKKIAEDIVSAGEVGPKDVVLEIGPGKGMLTEALLAKRCKVIAVEKDGALANYLREKFSGNKKLTLTEGDILDNKYQIPSTKYKVIANIPYYITSKIIRKFLTAKNPPTLMALMVQKEVGERITAKNGKGSLLSISVWAYGVPKIIRKVPAGAFFPKPDVDSAVLKISGIGKKFFKRVEEEKFFETVRKGFSSRRKMVKNNLKMAEGELEKCKIEKNARAEDLTLENWRCLSTK